jgi:polysaccharide biosynthesis/export protein
MGYIIRSDWKKGGMAMRTLFILLSFWVAIIAGCSSSVTGRPDLSQQYSYTTKEYRIQPGDQLDIKLFYNPELNELLTVRPDGRITMQLVNEVMAAGRTPAELTGVLAKAYSTELANPKVAVIVRTSISDKIYVDGEVNRAGMVTLIGPTSILQSISQAGGMKDTAKSDEVVVIRRGDDNKTTVFAVNLESALTGVDMTQDIAVRPNDIVYVPKSSIADVNTWIDLYIRKNIPLPIGLGYSF